MTKRRFFKPSHANDTGVIGYRMIDRDIFHLETLLRLLREKEATEELVVANTRAEIVLAQAKLARAKLLLQDQANIHFNEELV